MTLRLFNGVISAAALGLLTSHAHAGQRADDGNVQLYTAAVSTGANVAASLMDVEVGGAHLGQSCKEVDATMTAAGWSPGGGAEKNFTKPHEHIFISCVSATNGEVISAIRYRAEDVLISRDDLAASALKKFGPPTVAPGINPNWDKEYRIGWGDVRVSGPRWSDENSDGPSAFYQFVTRTDGVPPHLIALRAGKAWEKSQRDQLAAQEAARVRATTKPSF
jgi:hypothetical protein